MGIADNTISTPLNNLQLQVQRIFKMGLSEAELLEVSHLLSDYLNKRAIKAAGEAWDELGWDDQKVDELLKTKMRIKYNQHAGK